EERKQYDEKEMCRVYGNRMMWMALPFVVGAAIDLLYSGIGCFAACVIWTFQFDFTKQIPNKNIITAIPKSKITQIIIADTSLPALAIK
ncbi:UNVERIFIED_CONTAM: DUF3784 domain-containing protein, partial [Bacteroidetes bacterium 56_B9]